MIDDDLLNKFDSIEDLPISEEMLGAYLEDNLTAMEHLQTGQQIINNSDLSKFIKIISEEKSESLIPQNTLEVTPFLLPDIPKLNDFNDYHIQICESKNEISLKHYGRNKKTKR